MQLLCCCQLHLIRSWLLAAHLALLCFALLCFALVGMLGYWAVGLLGWAVGLLGCCWVAGLAYSLRQAYDHWQDQPGWLCKEGLSQYGCVEIKLQIKHRGGDDVRCHDEHTRSTASAQHTYSKVLCSRSWRRALSALILR